MEVARLIIQLFNFVMEAVRVESKRESDKKLDSIKVIRKNVQDNFQNKQLYLKKIYNKNFI